MNAHPFTEQDGYGKIDGCCQDGNHLGTQVPASDVSVREI
jgi:hypothetical protein